MILPEGGERREGVLLVIKVYGFNYYRNGGGGMGVKRGEPSGICLLCLIIYPLISLYYIYYELMDIYNI